MAAQRVVYLFGAGFSAPLGLPVMRDFLMRAKDMFAEDPTTFAHFAKVFEDIRGMSYAKNYFDSDLFNIEEVLSILEMEAHLGGSDSTPSFSRLIADVIRHHTPPITRREGWPPPDGGPLREAFGTDLRWRYYGRFVLGLFNRAVSPLRETSLLHCTAIVPVHAHYDVVTLNYDLILETAAGFTGGHPYQGAPLTFRNPDSVDALTDIPLLAKLHGSVDSGKIVPPTWQKGKHGHVVPAWTAAHKALRACNHIRILGYSLPDSDAYVRYLMKAAVKESPNLQQIDILCLDPTGDVERRYRRFITFENLRFASVSAMRYLELVEPRLIDSAGLEVGHREFWEWWSSKKS